jgi:hypothetical protein
MKSRARTSATTTIADAITHSVRDVACLAGGDVGVVVGVVGSGASSSTIECLRELDGNRSCSVMASSFRLLIQR